MSSPVSLNSDLLTLNDDLWTWRAVTQPLSGDDIPRIERPPDWLPDWSPDAVSMRRNHLAELEQRRASLHRDSAGWPVEQQVDLRLLGSALARAGWELEVQRAWQRNPYFYVQQTLGGIFELLLPPPPFDVGRLEQLIRRAEHIQVTLQAARENLAGHALKPFARLAIDALRDVRSRIHRVLSGLSSLCEPGDLARLERAAVVAATELESFADWLASRLQQMPEDTAIGRDAYIHFLQAVALVPLSPEQIVAGAQQELERAITFEAVEQQRNVTLPPIALPRTQTEQIEREADGERMLRQFCETNDLLTFPGWLKRYRNLPLPSYLAVLRDLGVTDDLTGPGRLDQDGTSYIPEPSADLPYFYLAMARDPRTLIAHEGMHYYQLAMSWAHPDPVRRHYYDSGPNEGIGFYAEEMLLQAGLFDDSPRSREIIYNFMRLRAVRVGVDVRLALGELTIDTAAEELAARVPMDRATAREEASMFASEPGQAITYQVGKLQILAFLAQTRRAVGDRFSLRSFHDRLWLNGNVPIALQRWETLGVLDTTTGLLAP